MPTVVIKHRFTGAALYSHETTDERQASGLALRDALECALRSGSDLRYSDLSGSDLSGSDLSGPNLRGSNLRGSDLRWSNLSGSDLSGSNLSGAWINYDPQIPGWKLGDDGCLWRSEN